MRALIGHEIATDRPDFAKFPVNFPVSRESGADVLVVQPRTFIRGKLRMQQTDCMGRRPAGEWRHGRRVLGRAERSSPHAA